MQHVIAAVFDNQNSINQARNDLINIGFDADDMHLSQSDVIDDSGQYAEKDESITSGIKSFFSSMFGDDNKNEADVYSSAVMDGNYVLTLNLQNEEDVEKATEVLDRYDPIDIDEQVSGMGSSSSMNSNSESDQSYDSTRALASDTDGSKSTYSGMQTQDDDSEKAIPVIQEELKVGKRTVQRGGVRVFQRVTETPVTKNVNLREEQVTIERRPVNQPANVTDLNAFKEGSFELREMAEEAVVEKSARVVEEVRIGKKATQHEEVIQDTLRSTNVEIEKLDGDMDLTGSRDSAYRTHWNSNYANAGTYDDYAPAYLYGSNISSDDRYKNASWDDVEPNVRRDWESKNVGSSWEKMKGAVRHGWEKMTN